MKVSKWLLKSSSVASGGCGCLSVQWRTGADDNREPKVSAGLCKSCAYLNKTAYEILLSCSFVYISTKLEKKKSHMTWEVFGEGCRKPRFGGEFEKPWVGQAE